MQRALEIARATQPAAAAVLTYARDKRARERGSESRVRFSGIFCRYGRKKGERERERNIGKEGRTLKRSASYAAGGFTIASTTCAVAATAAVLSLSSEPEKREMYVERERREQQRQKQRGNY